jgi:large subunit ribosomal protein L1
MKLTKRLAAVQDKVDKNRTYEPGAALALVKETATAKFDETVELHLRTGLERDADGYTSFDVALAQRELMGKVGRLGRILGPRGLMPNPRSSTVVETPDMARAVREAKAGRVEFRLDRTNLVHVAIGKVSFDEQTLLDNLAALMSEIVKSRPSAAKGQYIRSATLASTMGPGVPVEVAPMLALASEA